MKLPETWLARMGESARDGRLGALSAKHICPIRLANKKYTVKSNEATYAVPGFLTLAQRLLRLPWQTRTPS
jgi:hypothetical protein